VGEEERKVGGGGGGDGHRERRKKAGLKISRSLRKGSRREKCKRAERLIQEACSRHKGGRGSGREGTLKISNTPKSVLEIKKEGGREVIP